MIVTAILAIAFFFVAVTALLVALTVPSESGVKTGTRLAIAVACLFCAGISAYFHWNAPTKTETKVKTVEKTVYVLSPDGKAHDAPPANSTVKTGVTWVSDWSEPTTAHEWQHGFAVVEVDGQRCILWIRSTQAEFNGTDTGSGMNCRPIPPK